MKKQYAIEPYGVFVVDDQQQWKTASVLTKGEHPQQDELKIFEKFIDANSVFFDIGANIGTITIAMARIVKEVFAFEPMKNNIKLLEENISLNNLSNVRIYPVALGSGYDKVKLETEGGNSESFSVHGNGDIDLIPLDSISGAPAFIKIDVEGHEIEVLKGARQTIEKYKPVIWFEVNLMETRRRGDWWLKKVSNELYSKNYIIYLPSENGFRRIHSIAWEVFKCAPKAFLFGKLMYSTNFLALPADKTI